MATPEEKLALARKHLDRVQSAWDPPEWMDLSLYGFYCLEAALDAACLAKHVSVQKTHPARVQAASQMHADYKLPDIARLLRDLNEVRKSVAYGDVSAPELDAEEVASTIEEYVEAVAALLLQKKQ